MDNPSESESNPHPEGGSLDKAPTLEGATEPTASFDGATPSALEQGAMHPENTKVPESPISVVNIHRAGAEITAPDVLSQGPIAPLEDPTPPKLPLIRRIPVTRLIGVLLIVVGLMVGSGLALHGYNSSKHAALNDSATGASARLKQQTTSLSGIDKEIGASATGPKGTLTVNGQLQLTSSLVLQPTVVSGPSVIGQIYYDSTTNTLAYYNGTGTVHLSGGGIPSVTNNITNITNNTFVTNVAVASASGQSISGTPGALAVFGAGGTTLSDSLLRQSGTALATSATAFQGSSASGLSIVTADATGATGDLTVQSGNSTTTSSGTVTIDSGSGVVNGTVVDDFTFESNVNGFNNAPYGGSNAQSSAAAHSGTYSLGITLQANQWSALSSDDLTVVPGHEYRWSEWIRSSATSVSGSASVYFRDLNTTSATTAFTDNASGWTQLSGSFIDPAGNTRVDLSSVYKTILASPEVHYVDDVTLTDLNTFTGLTVNVGTTNAQAVNIGNSNQVGDTTIVGSTTGIKLKDTAGAITFSSPSTVVNPTVDSTKAFQVNNASGTSEFAVDTTNSALVIGNGGGAPSVPVIQGAAAIGNNIIGANMIFDAPNGTGVGGSGDIVFNTGAGLSNPLVTVDATSGLEGSLVSTLNWNHTTGAHPDEVLVVSVDSTGTGITPSSATSVTYNGVALTRLTNLVSFGSMNSEANGSVWYLVNPSAGSHAVSVTYDGSQSDVAAEATTFYNVDQSNPIEKFTTNQVSDNHVSTTLTGTDAGEGIYDALMARASIGNQVNPGNGQTFVYGQGYFSDSNFGSFRQGQSGSTTMSWSGNGNGSMINHVVIAFNPEPNVTPDTLTEALRISQTGDIGVNNSTPRYTLDVNGIANAATAVYTPSLDTNAAGTLAVGNTNATNIQLGGANTSTITLGKGGGTPVVPVIQGAAAVGNNIIGANMVFEAPDGTGVGGSGDIVFKTAKGVSDPQVTWDANSDDEENAASNNAQLSWVHTVGAQPDRVLIVSVGFEAPVTPVTVPQGTATSVSYDGLPLTELTSVAPNLGEASGSVWYLVNPPSGSNTVTANFTGPASNIGVEATSFYNVDPTNPIANFNGNNNPQGNTISTSLVGTNPGEMVFDSLFSRPDFGSITPGAGQSIVYNLGGAGFADKGSMKQGQSSATTMSWSGTGSSTIVDVLMALNPEPNVTPDTSSEAVRFTQAGTVGIGLASGENAQNTITFGGGADQSIGVNQNPGTGAGHNLTIMAGEGAVGGNNGGSLALQGGQATGAGISGGISMTTGNAANLSGGITLQTGNSSTTSAGNVSVDAGSSTVSGTTMVSNTFETSTENYGASNGGVAQDSSQAHSGTYSLSYTQGVGGTWNVFQQDHISVTPGHKYFVTAWVRGGANPSTISSAMWWVGSGTDTTLANVNESSTAWTEISGIVTAPAGATAGYLSFGGTWENAGFVHYLDDVTIVDMSSSSAQALVSVGGTNAQAVTVGNANEIDATNIFGGSGINLNSGVGNINMTSGGVIAKAEADSTTFFQLQNSTGGNLFVADTTDMTITINGSLVVSGNITVNGHVVTGGNIPTIAPPINCGTTPTAVLGSGVNDTAGSFTVATGSGSGTTCDTTITFNQPYASAPKSIILTPTVAISGTTTSTDARVSAVSTNSFTVQLDAPIGSTHYSYYYWVVQ